MDLYDRVAVREIDMIRSWLADVPANRPNVLEHNLSIELLNFLKYYC